MPAITYLDSLTGKLALLRFDEITEEQFELFCSGLPTEELVDLKTRMTDPESGFPPENISKEWAGAFMEIVNAAAEKRFADEMPATDGLESANTPAPDPSSWPGALPDDDDGKDYTRLEREHLAEVFTAAALVGLASTFASAGMTGLSDLSDKRVQQAADAAIKIGNVTATRFIAQT